MVLSIVLVLLSIAVPPLLRARDAANHAAAAGALHSITVGQTTYFTLYQGYAPTLKALGPPRDGQSASADAAGLIDAALAAGYRNGYRFRYIVLRRDENGLVIEYLVSAEPLRDGADLRLVLDQSGALAVNRSHREEGQGTVGEKKD